MKKEKSVKMGASKASRAVNGSMLAQCFIEHAARETAWMREHSKQCEYASAHNASVRREVWLMAALIAQEKKA